MNGGGVQVITPAARMDVMGWDTWGWRGGPTEMGENLYNYNGISPLWDYIKDYGVQVLQATYPVGCTSK